MKKEAIWCFFSATVFQDLINEEGHIFEQNIFSWVVICGTLSFVLCTLIKDKQNTLCFGLHRFA